MQKHSQCNKKKAISLISMGFFGYTLMITSFMTAPGLCCKGGLKLRKDGFIFYGVYLLQLLFISFFFRLRTFSFTPVSLTP